MVELLLPECEVVLGYADNSNIKVVTVKDLMPFSFSSEDLKND